MIASYAGSYDANRQSQERSQSAMCHDDRIGIADWARSYCNNASIECRLAL